MCGLEEEGKCGGGIWVCDLEEEAFCGVSAPPIVEGGRNKVARTLVCLWMRLVC